MSAPAAIVPPAPAAEKKPFDLKATVTLVAMILLIVGGLNWGLFGATQGRYDLVALVANYTHQHVGTVVYVLVGLAALWTIYAQFFAKA